MEDIEKEIIVIRQEIDRLNKLLKIEDEDDGPFVLHDMELHRRYKKLSDALNTILNVVEGTNFIPQPQKYPRGREDINAWTNRLKTSQGWVVTQYDENGNFALCFVPDPNHSWVLEGEK